MRKMIFIGLMLLSSSQLLRATPLSHFGSINFVEDELADQLAKNKDFQTFILSSFHLFQKVQLSKSSALFLKVANKNASREEIIQLSTKLGFKDEVDMRSSLSNTFAAKVATYKKFPTLDGLVNAKVVFAKAIKQILKPFKLTTGDCWNIWLALISACGFGCNYASDYSSCYFACTGAASGEAGICFLLADKLI